MYPLLFIILYWYSWCKNTSLRLKSCVCISSVEPCWCRVSVRKREREGEAWSCVWGCERVQEGCRRHRGCFWCLKCSWGCNWLAHADTHMCEWAHTHTHTFDWSLYLLEALFLLDWCVCVCGWMQAQQQIWDLLGGWKQYEGVMSHYWSLESLHSTNGKHPSFSPHAAESVHYLGMFCPFILDCLFGFHRVTGPQYYSTGDYWKWN